MSLTISDAEDALLTGQAEQAEWMQEFMIQWYAPLGKALLQGMIASQPPAVLDELKRRAPAALKDVMNGKAAS